MCLIVPLRQSSYVSWVDFAGYDLVVHNFRGAPVNLLVTQQAFGLALLRGMGYDPDKHKTKPIWHDKCGHPGIVALAWRVCFFKTPAVELISAHFCDVEALQKKEHLLRWLLHGPTTTEL